MIKGKGRKIKHLNNQKVQFWLPEHSSEDLKTGCILISLVWRNLYWECGCDHASGAWPWCAVWVCVWDKQFYMFLFWNFIKPFVLKCLHSQTFLLWETEQENSLLKVKMTGSSANIKPIVHCSHTWPYTGTAVTHRLQQNGAGGLPWLPPMSPCFPRAVRIANSKRRHPNRLGSWAGPPSAVLSLTASGPLHASSCLQTWQSQWQFCSFITLSSSG